jgi:hypothetical protein
LSCSTTRKPNPSGWWLLVNKGAHKKRWQPTQLAYVFNFPSVPSAFQTCANPSCQQQLRIPVTCCAQHAAPAGQFAAAFSQITQARTRTHEQHELNERTQRYANFIVSEDETEMTNEQRSVSLLGQKVRQRPEWATSDGALMRRVFGPRGMRRWECACLYWRHNWTAPRIAEHLGMTVGAVEQILFRITSEEKQSFLTETVRVFTNSEGAQAGEVG